MVVVLQNIRSVYNVASIFRTGDGVGVDRIYLCGVTPGPLDEFNKPRADFTKVSLGAQDSLLWIKFGSTVRLLDRLKGEGYKIFAVEQAKGSAPYYKVRVGKAEFEKVALVLGNEVRGLTPAVLRCADKVLEIPMLGRKESLNVSVAFGIVASHLRFS